MRTFDILSRRDLESLARHRGQHLISIYAPMKRAGAETRKNPIVWKNLVRRVAALLEQGGVEHEEIDLVLAPLRDRIEDHEFWQQQGEGLAFVSGNGFTRWFRLPIRTKELARIGDRFYLKALLPLIAGDDRFFLLALAQGEVRLFEGSRYTMEERSLPSGVPRRLEEAVGDELAQEHLQVHQAGAAQFIHGHGGGDDDTKDEIRRFCMQVDRGLAAVVQDVPMVVAGVDYLGAIYRSVSSLELAGHVPGSPQGLGADEIHLKAWPVVEPRFRRAREQAADRYRQLAGTGRASEDPAEVVPAAFDGRVDTLFVDLDAQRWGRYSPETRAFMKLVDDEPEAVDLLDVAAAQTLANGGTVYAVVAGEMPAAERPVAALFRY